jgi:adenosylcobinamide-phosphate synthase
VSALLGGYAADLAFGDPARMHPVAGFGQLASRLETTVYAPSRVRGAAFAAVLVGAAALAAEGLARAGRRAGLGRGAALALVTWAALGGRSLRREARHIASAVADGDLEAARRGLPALVGRDPAGLEAPEICRAVVESVAENTADAVLGALLWGAVAGPAGVAGYRAANTLDAMVGHRSARYAEFGWAAARLDDALNWPVARAGAGLVALCAPAVGGSAPAAWRTLRSDGAAHPSPNAGRMEAAFAGALDVTLGGELSYDGRMERRPPMGDGPAPGPEDILRAARLSWIVGLAAVGLCAVAGGLRRRG